MYSAFCRNRRESSPSERSARNTIHWRAESSSRKQPLAEGALTRCLEPGPLAGDPRKMRFADRYDPLGWMAQGAKRLGRSRVRNCDPIRRGGQWTAAIAPEAPRRVRGAVHHTDRRQTSPSRRLHQTEAERARVFGGAYHDATRSQPVHERLGPNFGVHDISGDTVRGELRRSDFRGQHTNFGAFSQTRQHGGDRIGTSRVFDECKHGRFQHGLLSARRP